MNWHLICRSGAQDNFLPNIKPSDPRLIVTFEESGVSHQAGNNVLQVMQENGLVPDDVIIDLLRLAMTVYTGDLRIERNFAPDKWTRDIAVELPVADIERWERAKPIITRMLAFLTGDKWELNLRNRTATENASTKEDGEYHPKIVTLFSGGLDSFVGAIDLLEEHTEHIFLVGQYGSGSTRPSQEKTHRILEDAYPERTTKLGFWVQPAKPGERSAENTMRSRSILFLALGTTVASACGNRTPLYVPENGLISLNVPLTYSRAGSLSTRTTHPYFISLYRNVLEALDIRVPVHLPYKFATKGEMLKDAKNQEVLRTGLPMTLSCSRPDAGRFQKRSPGTHCGYCVPCIIRLASMKAAGFDIEGAVHFDIANEEVNPRAVKGEDRRAFEIAIERVKLLSSLQLTGQVLQSGPLPPEDAAQYAAVYKRGLEEVAQLFRPAK